MRPSPALLAQLEQRIKSAQRSLENVKRQIVHEKGLVLAVRAEREGQIVDAQKAGQAIRAEAETWAESHRTAVIERASVVSDAAVGVEVNAETIISDALAEAERIKAAHTHEMLEIINGLVFLRSESERLAALKDTLEADVADLAQRQKDLEHSLSVTSKKFDTVSRNLK